MHQIVNLVVGRTLEAAFPPKALAIDVDARPVLAVDRLSGHGFHEVTLHARPGEIIGLAGIEGNGQRDFLRALAGTRCVVRRGSRQRREARYLQCLGIAASGVWFTCPASATARR